MSIVEKTSESALPPPKVQVATSSKDVEFSAFANT